MNKVIARKLRCAVYTRKSSEEGLDQEFNSLDAQRDSCEAYIASQKAEGWLLVRGLRADTPIYGGFMHHWRYPRSSAATVVQTLTGRDDSLGVWGWACNLHVESGVRQATRDGTTLWSIQENPQRDYHRAVYLADLRRNAPAVFVDAVGPGAFSYEHRELQAHEIFPELAQALKDAGVSDYSIWLDAEACHLFGILTLTDDNTMDKLPETEIVKRWWAFMADIMATDADNVPVQIPLQRVFYLK